MRKLSTDEELAKAFFASYSLEAEPYEDSQLQESRTPDFKVSYPQDGFFFFSEVKSFNTKVGSKGLSPTRVFNIFTAGIHDAYGQFKAVNSHRIVPNVLVFVTHNFQIDWHAFKEFLQGYIAFPNGGKESIIPLKRVSESFYKNEVKQIDLFVFLQGKKPDFFFSKVDQFFTDKLLRVFRIDREKVSSLRVG
jgi:hypothetical protein